MKVQKVAVNAVHVKNRVREDYGDMETLKSSIKKYGLLNPIIIDADNNLIAGARRLKAFEELGYDEIDASVLDENSKLVRFDMEMQENLVRKDFSENEIDRSIEMKKRLLRKPWLQRLWKKITGFFRSLFGKKGD